MSKRAWLQVIGILGALAVGAGAFGTHSLRDQVSPERLAAWQTGCRYLIWHDLALLAFTLSGEDLDRWRWVMRAWLAGAIIFAGSLFALVLLDAGWFGAITPAGGILLITGWVLLFRGALLDKS